MAQFKKILAIVMAVCLVLAVGVVAVGAVDSAKTDAAAEPVGAGGIKASARIDTLTFEERKLVEVAAAMHSQPKILILDETTTALSQNGRDKIYSLIRQMREEGKTVIEGGPDLPISQTFRALAERLLALDGGRSGDC